MRLVAALNASNLMSQAVTTLGVAGTRPPPLVIETVARLADAITTKGPPPMIPPAWDASPGTLALRDAMAGVARVLSRDWSPGDRTRAELSDELRERSGVADRILRAVGGGQVSRTFVVRLMACMGVAGLVSEVLPLQRSYWVPLTVAIVLKPDYGSVFARAVQRGIGTIVGAVAGAVLLVLFHGAWLLVPFGVLAALLPYGRSRNYGLLATFLTPLVVVLVDLLKPVGWRLAGDRLVDTLIGCAIVLVVGFAPWPMSWYAHLPGKFGQAALDVCEYMNEALALPPPASGAAVSSAAARSRRLRSTYRALGDLRAEFQRTMSEPPSISRSAAAWWPAVVGLEQVLDAVTSVSVAVSRGASVPPSGVRQLCAALHAVSEAASAGRRRRPTSSCRTIRRWSRSPGRSGRCWAFWPAASGWAGSAYPGCRGGSLPGLLSGVACRGRCSGVVGLAGFEPAASATQNCYEPRTRMLNLLQAGKDLVAGCENDGEDTLSTGFMKQLGLHGSLSYVRPRPVLRPVQSPPSSRH